MSPSELGLMIKIELMLSAKFQALRQQARQTGLDDFILRGVEVVFDPALFDAISLDVIDGISSPPIAVARLADAAGVDEIFFVRLDHELIGLHAPDSVVADKRAG